MFNTSIIEIVVGLIFVFSLIAILVTQINGLINTALNIRAVELKQGITDLIHDKKIRAKILGHPIINMVQTTVVTEAHISEEQAENISNIAPTRVTYIPANTFVEALIGVLIAQADTDLYRMLQDAVNEVPSSLEKSKLREQIRKLRSLFSEETLRSIYNIAGQIPDEAYRAKILTSLNDLEEKIEKLYFKSDELVPLVEGLSHIENDRFRSALQTILVGARNLDEARTKLETWFNDNMDRVTEKFKRRVQKYSIGVALTICVVFNVDALFLARTLWEDEALRAAVAIAAEDFQQEAAANETNNDNQGASLPTDMNAATSILIADEGDESPADPATDDPTDEGGSTFGQLEQQARETRETIQTLLDLQLPIGWQFETITDTMVESSLELGLQNPYANTRNIWNFVPGNSDSWLSLWIQKILGIAVTTIAAAQGAPFWFDLLNRLTRR